MFVELLLPESGNAIPKRGELVLPEALYRRSVATAAIIVVHAVCSVESRATLMPAGMRPCIVAMQMPTMPKARATSTMVNPSFISALVFLFFMFCWG